MIDPSLTGYLRTRAEAWDRLRRYGAQSHELETNDRLIRELAKRTDIGGNAEKATALAADNERVRAMFGPMRAEARIFRDDMEAAHVVSFPMVTIDDFRDAWEATRLIVGIPDPFDHLPFPSCYLAFGTGIVMPATPTEAGPSDVRCVAFVATRARNVWTISSAEGRPDGLGLWPSALCLDGAWDDQSVAIGWLLHAMLTALDEVPPARVVTTSTLTTRRLADRAVNAGAPRRAPPPFYEVRIGADHFRSIVRHVTTEPIEFSHRWDVRAHNRRRFLRGLGGAPAVEEADMLARRGYAIHPPGDPEVAEALALRGLPSPGPDEWIASRTSRVREHVKGPEDRPYVPSVRVVDADPVTPA